MHTLSVSVFPPLMGAYVYIHTDRQKKKCACPYVHAHAHTHTHTHTHTHGKYTSSHICGNLLSFTNFCDMPCYTFHFAFHIEIGNCRSACCLFVVFEQSSRIRNDRARREFSIRQDVVGIFHKLSAETD